MAAVRAPGLQADWLNAWLAGVGVTVLVPGSKLGWSDDPIPSATLEVPGDMPIDQAIAQALPSTEELGRLAVAQDLPGFSHFGRKVDLDTYRDRARFARSEGDFTLGACVTDLLAELKETDMPHSPFDPPVPKGLTLWNRLDSCRRAIDEPVSGWVTDTLNGRGRRVVSNGLGFDYRRMASGVHANSSKMVDPVVECLAFFSLALFPFRGNGFQERQRGWRDWPSRRGAFRWPTWSAMLDCWAIDAILEVGFQDPRGGCLMGINGWFQSVYYEPIGSRDVTRAYAGERVVEH